MRKLPLILSLALLSCSSIVQAQQLSPSNRYNQAVTREVLASGYPAQDQAQILELVRFTIAPKAKLPVHIHPGIQIVRIESGTLTYTVIKGEAQITRTDGTKVTMKAGETLALKPGDALVEAAGMVHYGANQTNHPVVLIAASLLDANQPKAILIDPQNR